MMKLPAHIPQVGVPPMKCQGIKTKLVRFLAGNIAWGGRGRWLEPFLGSGVVLFNLQPERALVADTNRHIIEFYRQIQQNKLDAALARDYLQDAGEKLRRGGQDFYLEVRRRFNETGEPLDFLFLNRSCFNGLMRFNGKGGYNVPFGHKPERFAPAYITKIANQITWVQKVMRGKDWEFLTADWRETLARAQPDDFAYLDPPYAGRHADYYNRWTEKDAAILAEEAKKLPCGFALSTWLENKYRRNEHIANYWHGFAVRTFAHFYHVGASEDLRNEMQEALIAAPHSLGDAVRADYVPNAPAIQATLF